MQSDFKICIECNQFLNDVLQFVTKSKIIDAMFMEIQQQHPDESHQELLMGDLPPVIKQIELDQKLIEIRQKFGLKPLEVPIETLNNLFEESNNIAGDITASLEIKLESEVDDFEVNDVLPDELQVSDSSEEEEDESEIEELSEAQLKRHDDRLESHEELHEADGSSESGQEERKKRRKKYRKSDEEKLFE